MVVVLVISGQTWSKSKSGI